MPALSPRVVTWLRRRLPSSARAQVFALAGPGFVAVEDWPPERQAPATLAQCVVLAMLLHLLLVAVVGNAPPGSAEPGQGVWGALNITLRGVRPDPGAAAGVPAPDAYSGPLGTADKRRWGGAVRAPEAQALPDPGAARRGVWNATPTGRAADDEQPVPRSPAPVLQAVEPQPAPAATAPLSAPDPAPPIVAAPALTGPSSSVAESEPPPAAQEPAATSAFPPLEVPPSGARPGLAELGEFGRAPELARPMDVSPLPDLQPLPPPPRQMPTLPSAAPGLQEGLAPARSAPLPLPSLAEAAVPPPLRRLPPEAQSKRLALPEAAAPRPVEALQPRSAEPLPLPSLAQAPLATDLKPVPEPPASKDLQPLPAPPLAQAPVRPEVEPLRTPELPDLPSMTALPPVPVPAASPAPSQASVARPADAPAAGPPTMAMPADVGPGLPRPATGAPDAGARAGRDVATPAAQAASAPRLNLDLARPRGGEISRQSSRGVLPLMPRPPEIKSRLAEDIEKAARADCRTAHSGAGLLAVGPLVADALRGKGCKW
jgi:hypothetical protein